MKAIDHKPLIKNLVKKPRKKQMINDIHNI